MRRPGSHPYLGLALIILIPVVVLFAVALWSGLLFKFGWARSHGGQLIGLLLVLASFAISILWTASRRLRTQDAGTNKSLEPQPHVLYLRSFQDDQASLTATDTREQHLASVMKEVGPLVAIGRPGDSLAPLGAERRYCEEKDWQHEVELLIAQAKLVVIQAGASNGLLWEINEVTKHLKPEKILISLRSKERVFRLASDKFSQEQYERFRVMTAQFFQRPLPEKLEDAAFLCFESDWKPHLLRPTRWKPYNLSPTAKIRETLRPFLEQQGVEFSVFRTQLMAVLWSLLLVFGFVLLIGGLSVSFLK
jgi:hypothetical protein